jgi:hypothetical protein
MSGQVDKYVSDNQPRRLGSDDVGDLSETKVYGVCVGISLVWICSGFVYFAAKPGNFLRMWPHEFGSLLSGWAAPLAALWFFTAVLLQRAQLKAQRLELKHTSEELRRSVELLERNALSTQLARLSDRMMHGALRFAKTGEGREFYFAKQGRREVVADLLGGYRKYADLFRANEVSRALEQLSKGLAAIRLKISEEWVLHADVEVIDELCTELTALDRIVSEVLRLSPAIDSLNLGADVPEKCVLEAFRQQAAVTNETLESMLHGLRNFDVAEGTSDGGGSEPATLS